MVTKEDIIQMVTKEDISHFVEGIREATDKGMLIEAGWGVFREMTVPKEADADQLHEMKRSFFCGAMHMFESLRIIHEGIDQKDRNRLNLIAGEINRFKTAMELQFSDVEGNA
jgi:hypothetical protein